MNFSIELDHEHKLIRYTHVGAINRHDIGMAWRQLLNMREFFEQRYNLLSDYTKAEFEIDVADVELIVSFLSTISSVLRDKRQALVVDKPFNTAIAILFENDVYAKIGFIVRTFSTTQAAFKWLVS